MSANPITITPVATQWRQSAPLAWTVTASILTSDFLSLSFLFVIAGLDPGYHASVFFELLPLVLIMIAAFCLQGLYPGVLMHPAEEMRRIALAVASVFLVIASSAFLFGNNGSFSRSLFLVIWAAGCPLVFLARYAVRRALMRFDWWGVPAVVLGSGPTAHRVMRTLRDGRWGVRVTGFLSEAAVNQWPDALPQHLGTLALAHESAVSNRSAYAIIAMPEKSQQEIRKIIQDHCQGVCRILLVPDMPGACSLGMVAREVGGELGFEIPQRLFQFWPAICKRSLDICIALSGIVAASPLFVFLYLAVKLSSRGPALYGQTRQGRDGRTFRALKFRSMVSNADAILTAHLAQHPGDLFEWQRDHKLKKDPRVTSAGRWMRRLSLDELPQLLNVLATQMSIVGPRPIVMAEIEKYGTSYALYRRVRPGITGLWQVSGRNNTTYEERIRIDEYYVNNWSVWLDAYILLRTFKVVVTAEGAY